MSSNEFTVRGLVFRDLSKMGPYNFELSLTVLKFKVHNLDFECHMSTYMDLERLKRTYIILLFTSQLADNSIGLNK
jgi:hypothetical protein